MNNMLIGLGAPQNLWREAFLTFNYILNKVSPSNVRKDIM